MENRANMTYKEVRGERDRLGSLAGGKKSRVGLPIQKPKTQYSKVVATKLFIFFRAEGAVLRVG